jgi:hypothetical protein
MGFGFLREVISLWLVTPIPTLLVANQIGKTLVALVIFIQIP